MFWDNFYNACISRGIKPNPLAKELNIASGSMTSWKNGKIPNGETLLKISEYLGVSVDYLLGRVENQNGVTQVNTGDVGNHSNMNNSSKTELDEMSRELLNKFKELSFDDKIEVFNYIKNKKIP